MLVSAPSNTHNETCTPTPFFKTSFNTAQNYIRFVKYTGNLAIAAELRLRASKCNEQMIKIMEDQNLEDVFKRIELVSAERSFNQDLDEIRKTFWTIPFKKLPEQMDLLKTTHPGSYSELPEFLVLEKSRVLLDHDQVEVPALRENLEQILFSQNEKNDLKLEKRIANLIVEPFWKPNGYDVRTAMYKMAKKSLKSLKEYRSYLSHLILLPILATPKEALQGLLEENQIKEPLAANSVVHHIEKQNQRNNMEDASFIEENEDRILSGVFDGHGGDFVSQFARDRMRMDFDKTLEACEGNVHKALESVFYEIQKELRIDHVSKAFYVGSTAVVMYIDKKSRLMYVATLGDSEATIYRNIEGVVKAIPACRILNWSSPSEAKRAAKFHKHEGLYNKWVNHNEPKSLYCSNNGFGVNVSRAFGDLAYAGNEKQPLMSAEPEITVFPVEENDIIILASDGLEDDVFKDTVAQGIQNAGMDENLAEIFAQQAIKLGAEDNITVITLRIPGK